MVLLGTAGRADNCLTKFSLVRLQLAYGCLVLVVVGSGARSDQTQPSLTRARSIVHIHHHFGSPRSPHPLVHIHHRIFTTVSARSIVHHRLGPLRPLNRTYLSPFRLASHGPSYIFITVSARPIIDIHHRFGLLRPSIADIHHRFGSLCSPHHQHLPPFRLVSLARHQHSSPFRVRSLRLRFATV